MAVVPVFWKRALKVNVSVFRIVKVKSVVPMVVGASVAPAMACKRLVCLEAVSASRCAVVWIVAPMAAGGHVESAWVPRTSALPECACASRRVLVSPVVLMVVVVVVEPATVNWIASVIPVSTGSVRQSRLQAVA